MTCPRSHSKPLLQRQSGLLAMPCSSGASCQCAICCKEKPTRSWKEASVSVSWKHAHCGGPRALRASLVRTSRDGAGKSAMSSLFKSHISLRGILMKKLERSLYILFIPSIFLKNVFHFCCIGPSVAKETVVRELNCW